MPGDVGFAMHFDDLLPFAAFVVGVQQYLVGVVELLVVVEVEVEAVVEVAGYSVVGGLLS